MLDISTRAMNAEERHTIEARRDDLRARAGTALLRFGTVSLLGCGALAVLTLVVSGSPPLVVLGFWTAMALLFTFWTGWPERRQLASQAQVLDEALRAQLVHVTRIASDRVVEVEEVEDEGACFAFDAGGNRSIVVAGQAFYEDDRFPNSDFSIVDVLMSDGRTADVLVTFAGRKMVPERRVAADRKLSMDLPDHLEVVDTPLERFGM